jgi:Holliday junction DNA helicase RuvA
VITGISGKLARVYEDEVRVNVGGIEYQVLVPDLVRRNLQMLVGQDVTLHTIEYIEGNPQRGRMTPRLVGFTSEPEIEFFELFCTVDGIGVRTALKAMVRPIRDVADLIQRQDAAGLSTLPGVSSSTAERVIAKLRKKVTKFALMVDHSNPAAQHVAEATSDVIQDAFIALVSVGHSDLDARAKIDKVLTKGKKFKSAQDILLEVYQLQ